MPTSAVPCRPEVAQLKLANLLPLLQSGQSHDRRRLPGNEGEAQLTQRWCERRRLEGAERNHCQALFPKELPSRPSSYRREACPISKAPIPHVSPGSSRCRRSFSRLDGRGGLPWSHRRPAARAAGDGLGCHRQAERPANCQSQSRPGDQHANGRRAAPRRRHPVCAGSGLGSPSAGGSIKAGTPCPSEPYPCCAGANRSARSGAQEAPRRRRRRRLLSIGSTAARGWPSTPTASGTPAP